MSDLYLDLTMGAAGDMFAATLFELVDNNEKEQALEELNGMGIEGVEFTPELSEKCGIRGTHMKVSVHGVQEQQGDSHLNLHPEESHVTEELHATEESHAAEELNATEESHATEESRVTEEPHTTKAHHCHEHHSYQEVMEIISSLNVSEEEKADVIAVYDILAKAECAVHNVSIEELCFHEVGMKDAIADVAAVCHLMRRLNIQKVVASTMHTGYGKIHCAHGIMDVPTPATAAIIKEIPHTSGDMEGELCTPTGAALIKYFVNEYVDISELHLLQNKVHFNHASFGHGMGNKDFPRPNVLKSILI